MVPTCKRWPVAVEDVWQEWRENWSSRLIPVLRLILAPSLLAAWKLNLLSKVKCHCPLAPVVQVVVDDEGGVVEGRQQVRHGGGARLVAPAEGQSVQRRVEEVLRLGQRGLGVISTQYISMNTNNKYVPSYLYLHRIWYRWDLWWFFHTVKENK